MWNQIGRAKKLIQTYGEQNFMPFDYTTIVNNFFQNCMLFAALPPQNFWMRIMLLSSYNLYILHDSEYNTHLCRGQGLTFCYYEHFMMVS